MKKQTFSAIIGICMVIAGCSKELTPESNAVVSLASGGASSGTTYYVSPSGSDSNAGTSETSPWQSISKVNATTLTAGDAVLFQGGQSFSGTLTIINSGSSSAFITVGSYGTGQATIIAGAGTGVYIYNQGYVHVDNLIVTGAWSSTTQSGNTGYGIVFYTDVSSSNKLGYIWVSNCNVSGFNKSGICALSYPSDASQSGYSVVKINNNAVHDNGVSGISTSGYQGASGNTKYCFDSVAIEYNTVYNINGVTATTTTHTGDGIIIGQSGKGLIQHNVAYNNGWLNSCTTSGPCAIWCWDSKGLYIQYNESYNNGTNSGTDGDGFDMDGAVTYCVMQYNYSHSNYGAGFLVWEYGATRAKNSYNVIRYNISQNDAYGKPAKYGALTIGTSCTYNKYYNNTIYTSGTVSPLIAYGGSSNGVYNNIFYSAGGATVVSCPGKYATFIGNNYYPGSGTLKIAYNGTTYTTLTNFRKTGNEKYNSVSYGYSANPNLINPGNGATIGTGYPNTLANYQLSSGSSMINTAFNLSNLSLTVGSYDFNGSTIPNGTAYDIGACEYH